MVADPDVAADLEQLGDDPPSAICQLVGVPSAVGNAATKPFWAASSVQP